MTTLVYQSLSESGTPVWMERCTASVRAWADAQGYAYHRFGDDAFELAPPWCLDKAGGRRPMVMDLVRLLLARDLLGEFERVVWLDADVLVFRPDALVLPADVSFAFGREVWVQPDADGRLKTFRNVHNAVCVFSLGNPMLEFYIHAATEILRRLDRGGAPQLIGPKLLTALHSLVGFPLIDAVGAFSPTVLRAIAVGGGPALDLLLRETPVPLAAANLCASLEPESGPALPAAIEWLLHDAGALLYPAHG
ncbi:MAG: hypothetical protein QNJ92_06240 [Alphaproteobacteria bacterium]|nr:hypothetical protein [Alphaproteobacteria bacterium]